MTYLRCKQCRCKITSKCAKKFCSRSCSAIFNNSKYPKRVRRVFKSKCLWCRSTFEYKPTSHNGYYCCLQCQYEYQWWLCKQRIRKGLISRSTLLKKYLTEKFGYNCRLCNQSGIWKKKKLVLHLDHIDGDSDNNYPRNLRLLCPNCHSQTPTYCSKGSGNKLRKNTSRNKYLRKYKGY
jgi:hypothetical protein